MKQNIFYPPSRTLMGPGPSDVPARVLQALAKPTLGHLDPCFIELMNHIQKLLRATFLTKNPLTLPISAPGSAGMEACFVNLVEPKEKVLICQNGVFGTRMEEIVKRIGGQAILVKDDWGRAVDPEKVEDALKTHPDTAILAFVHGETSTGALSDAKILGQLAQKYDCLSIVDAVTTLGGVELQVDDWSLDAVYSGTQKCLSAPPGLSPVTFSPRAVEKIKQRKSPILSWFLDLKLILQYWDDDSNKRTYHHTAPVNGLYGLLEALTILQEEGLEQAWSRHKRMHNLLKKRLEKLDLQFMVPENERLPQLNSIVVPEKLNAEQVRAYVLEKFNLEIGAGLGPMAGKIWRIGLMGASASINNVSLCATALEESLNMA